jgi:hypothetical protein
MWITTQSQAAEPGIQNDRQQETQTKETHPSYQPHPEITAGKQHHIGVAGDIISDSRAPSTQRPQGMPGRPTDVSDPSQGKKAEPRQTDERRNASAAG